MRKKPSQLTYWSCVLGNILDHYDTALYGFLAPFIAPQFFPHHDPVVSLILTYGLMSSALVMRPLGSYFFGRWGIRHDVRSGLILSFWGLAITTGGMGIIPPYEKIGVLAPILLALARAFQGFFAVGESTIAPLLLLSTVKEEKHSRTSSLYQSTTMLGIIIASFVASGVSLSSNPELLWRIPFLCGALTAFIGLMLRYSLPVLEPQKKTSLPSHHLLPLIRQNKPAFFVAILVSALSYLTYSIPFVFFNSFIPLVTPVSLNQMLVINSWLLILDMMMLPVFGRIAEKFSSAYFMVGVALLLALVSIPLFTLIHPHTSVGVVTFIRVTIVLLGLAFAAPLYAWLFSQFSGNERYLLSGVSYAIGAEVFGRGTPTICLWLWYVTGWRIAPAFYILALSGLTAGGLFFLRQYQKRT